ncbi:hypothetical protein AVEN_14306-1 [Araneus ventricosus]|uniref:Uncharacterized protein n=1 Tax=Araneus ventricosus TaxID=182803 RepID=A0A4Y2JWU7_ARAVE|nr:hypothetical protein AVEN_14306-1 [Araneus ventricosus]
MQTRQQSEILRIPKMFKDEVLFWADSLLGELLVATVLGHDFGEIKQGVPELHLQTSRGHREHWLKSCSGNGCVALYVMSKVSVVQVPHCKSRLSEVILNRFMNAELLNIYSINGLLEIGRGGLVVWSRLWSRRAPGSRPDSTEDPPCMGPVAH